MTAIGRVRVSLTGVTGLPGVSTFYATIGPDLQSPIRAWYEALKSYFPGGMSIQVAGQGDIIEDSTGVLTGQWTAAAPAAVVATGTGNYAAPVGAAVSWLTNTISDGRRIRGRTFLVPLVQVAYDSSGTLSAGFLTALNSATLALQVAVGTNMLVYRRPRPAKPADGSVPAVTFRAGTSAPVSATAWNDKAAVLRSRRD